jgi:hypothetical protein
MVKKFIFEGPIHRKTLKKKIRMIFKFFGGLVSPKPGEVLFLVGTRGGAT